MYAVALNDVISKMKLTKLTPDIDTDSINITQSDVNRLALQLTGYFNFFDSDRVQIIGKVEHTYFRTLDSERRTVIIRKLCESKIPCIVMCRDLPASDELLEQARIYGIPVLQSTMTTSYFMSELITYLKLELAPRISIHGVLVDVYGEGVLIMGESGIGKSEAALELIKRGHRLVADDVVEIKKISDQSLLGTSPDIIRHFIELRGIGIVDCKTLFGVESVKENQTIDLVIKLEEWDSHKEYDRLGLVEEYTEILGNKVTCHAIPIRPGRNLSIIVESAAINHRQKSMGYNAAQELNDRVMGNLAKRSKERKEEADKQKINLD